MFESPILLFFSVVFLYAHQTQKNNGRRTLISYLGVINSSKKKMYISSLQLPVLTKYQSLFKL